MAIFFGCQCWHMGKSLLQNFPHKQNEFNISSACTDLREPCDRIDTKRANDLKKCWNYFRMIDTSLWPNLSKLILRSWIYSHKELFSRSFYHQIGFAKVLSQNKIHPFLINSRIHYWCLRPVSNWYHHFQCKSQFAIKTGQFHPMGIWLDFSTRGLQVFQIRATALNLFKWATSAVSGSVYSPYSLQDSKCESKSYSHFGKSLCEYWKYAQVDKRTLFPLSSISNQFLLIWTASISIIEIIW